MAAIYYFIPTVLINLENLPTSSLETHLDPLMEQYHSLTSLLSQLERTQGQSGKEGAIQE